MAEPIITIDRLSKKYRIGAREMKGRTFREAVMDAFTAPVRNFRRLRQLTRFDDADSGGAAPGTGTTAASPGDVIWALKDVSFEVQPGEVVGIIGRNGAGKSTLLKILSRITEPSSGEVKLYGRVSSLLEVGTGFHPELTGRENIYLNGTILGMRKTEIDVKFDEIVAFSEIEKFLDTPVKRYSSGMYVRLAFALAAHLDPDILLVDEVLAVGDATFQKKCLGKMHDISSQEGRTILFVSHNMPAVRKFCHRGILLDSGRINLDDEAGIVISHYLESDSSPWSSRYWQYNTCPGNQAIGIVSARILDSNGDEASFTNISEDMTVEITYTVKRDGVVPQFSIILLDAEGNSAFSSLSNKDHEGYGKPLSKGVYRSQCTIYGNLLNSGRFFITIAGFINHWHDGFRIDNALSFDAVDDGYLKGDYHGDYSGSVRPLLKWKTEELNESPEWNL
ncbi:MAG: ABC transporter ATP-binding protein [Desulfomonilia bacterium]